MQPFKCNVSRACEQSLQQGFVHDNGGAENHFFQENQRKDATNHAVNLEWVVLQSHLIGGRVTSLAQKFISVQ